MTSRRPPDRPKLTSGSSKILTVRLRVCALAIFGLLAALGPACTPTIVTKTVNVPGSPAPTSPPAHSSNMSGGGGVDGGGGRGVVCRNPDESIRSVELLDFFEAADRYNRVIVKSTAPAIEQAKAAMENFGAGSEFGVLPFNRDYWRARIDDIVSRMPSRKNMSRSRLNLVNDSHEPIFPRESGCAIEQLANYTPDGDILVDQEIREKMDPTTEAGLLVHEAIYKHFRYFGATDSTRARRANGLLFSGYVFERLDARAPKRRWECGTMSSDPAIAGPGPKASAFYLAIRPSGTSLESAQFEIHAKWVGTRRMVGPAIALVRSGADNATMEKLAQGPEASETRESTTSDAFFNDRSFGTWDGPLTSEVDQGLMVSFHVLGESIKSFVQSRSGPTASSLIPYDSQKYALPIQIVRGYEFDVKIGFSNKEQQFPDINAHCWPDMDSWPASEIH
jgi:hypothetical protein